MTHFSKVLFCLPELIHRVSSTDSVWQCFLQNVRTNFLIFFRGGIDRETDRLWRPKDVETGSPTDLKLTH